MHPQSHHHYIQVVCCHVLRSMFISQVTINHVQVCRMSEVPLKDHQLIVPFPLIHLPEVMSLASRLSKIQEVKKPELPSIDHFTLEQLGAMTIDFGNTHKGRSFQHMWEVEQEWIVWFLQHYSKSSKMSHRLFCKFAELQIEMAENWNHRVPVYPTSRDVTSENLTKEKMVPKAKAKMGAKTKGSVMPSYTPAFDMESGEKDEFEMLQEWELEQHLDGLTVTTIQADVLSLQDRMSNMENMLQQVLNHLQPKAAESSSG